MQTQGSPPLARGTVLVSQRGGGNFRITPACAGNSHIGTLKLSAVWDHPRLRGEQATDNGWGDAWIGSPPLARGTEYLAGVTDDNGGITPACAGNRAKS